MDKNELKHIEVLSPDFEFSDDRGMLVQIAHDRFRQVNAVFTKKGKKRGRGHYHVLTSEAFFIIRGKVLVSVERDGYAEEAVFGTGDMFSIQPLVKHSFDYLEDTYMVVLYSEPIELPDGKKDIVE